KDASCFAGIAGERECALEHIARRQHAELVTKDAGAAAAVKHGHDSVRLYPRVGFQSAEQARQTGASAKATHSHLAQTHRTHSTIDPCRSLTPSLQSIATYARCLAIVCDRSSPTRSPTARRALHSQCWSSSRR